MMFSFRRLLLDPVAEAAGGSAAAPPAAAGQTAAPPATAAPAAAQAVPMADDRVSIPLSAYTELVGYKTAAQAAKEEIENQKRIALAESGNGRKALEQLEANWKTKYEGLLSKVQGQAVDHSIVHGISTAGVSFRSEAARSQAFNLLKGEFGVRQNPDGTESVVDKQGRPAAAAVAEMLKSEDFAHFLAPTTTGGAGAGGGNRPAPTGGQTGEELSEAEKITLGWYGQMADAAKKGQYTPSVLNGLRAAERLAQHGRN